MGVIQESGFFPQLLDLFFVWKPDEKTGPVIWDTTILDHPHI